MNDFKGFNIPLPPLALQQTFAAQIEAIEQQKALIRRSLDETRTLLAARMQYYFE
jgi:type I restriction enzyme S subunit